MMRRAWRPLAAACFIGTIAAACGGRARPQLPPPEPAPIIPAPNLKSAIQPEPEDSVARLIERSEQHFAAGQQEFSLGHLEQAKVEFDRAVDVLLAAPEGTRTDPRLRVHFDRLIDRINALELQALAQGDGFTEKRYDPATIDQLLDTATFPPPDAGADTRASVESDLRATAHDIPIELNARVLSYVELFQNRLRDWFQESLGRGAQYLPMIQDVFRAEGLPLDLAYVPLIESAFNPNALSRASAKGVWQFMRGTAVANGLRHDWYVDERANPEKATVAAAKYLRGLYDMFDGDWNLALASYNGGPGRVQRAIKRARTGDFWTLSQSSRYLPRETREYVPMILAAIIIAKNPVQYGFQLVERTLPPYEKVTLPAPVDLRKVAEWTGTSVSEIQSLNPELRRWTTPLKDDEYELRVPAGTAGRLTTKLATASPSELISVSEYVVRRGDTLSTIARRLKVGTTDLADANRLSRKSILRPGQRLIVPRALSAALTAGTRRSPSAGPPRTAAVSAASRVVYRVRRGDTLWSIAQEFETTVEAIRSWNSLRSSRINVGDRLTIYPSRAGGQ
jgi:membrane-bound lytic murein transglycosylase D